MVWNFFKIGLILIVINIPQNDALLSRISNFLGLDQLVGHLSKHGEPPKHHRIRVHLEGDEHLIVPKHASVKLLRPLPLVEAVSAEAHLAHRPPPGLLLSELLRPQIAAAEPAPAPLPPAGEEGVKPVHEQVDDDLRYDFRTKTHSI